MMLGNQKEHVISASEIKVESGIVSMKLIWTTNNTFLYFKLSLTVKEVVHL